ncbi:hypothetical protein DVDV_0183 [Desulfovibrio sp. DV]|uniref:hypothetical protein n=1 Tax=Desulfovibrio sp. DV TaxID=1844708 RepID=UPI00094BAD4A|nr:hypothetical protein [Desulfovibrio sp. DV]OLN31061.1 hypothetical protein DVDV_0183 [Desulfovibrio sp. DV]
MASDDLRTLALQLLERRPPPGPVVPARMVLPGSLPALIETLARPGAAIDPPVLAGLCLKYFHAYVHPEHLAADVSLDALTELAGQFVRRRGGCAQLAGQGGLRRFLLHHGFALQMLVDLPKTVHLLAALLTAEVPAGQGFLGLDIGAGTGILLLGQYLAARRAGFEAPTLIGFECQPHVAERAHSLVSALGIGRVHRADATKAGVYAELPDGPVACVTNETLPSAGRRLYKEPFAAINEALFAALGPRLANTVFLPEAVWACDRPGRSWLRLAPQNAFAGDGGGQGKPLRLAFMRDVELAGQRIPVDRVGEGLAGLVSPPWQESLCRRW